VQRRERMTRKRFVQFMANHPKSLVLRGPAAAPTIGGGSGRAWVMR
jgi:hypothetical protein